MDYVRAYGAYGKTNGICKNYYSQGGEVNPPKM